MLSTHIIYECSALLTAFIQLQLNYVMFRSLLWCFENKIPLECMNSSPTNTRPIRLHTVKPCNASWIHFVWMFLEYLHTIDNCSENNTILSDVPHTYSILRTSRKHHDKFSMKIIYVNNTLYFGSGAIAELNLLNLYNKIGSDIPYT